MAKKIGLLSCVLVLCVLSCLLVLFLFLASPAYKSKSKSKSLSNSALLLGGRGLGLFQLLLLILPPYSTSYPNAMESAVGRHLSLVVRLIAARTHYESVTDGNAPVDGIRNLVSTKLGVAVEVPWAGSEANVAQDELFVDKCRPSLRVLHLGIRDLSDLPQRQFCAPASLRFRGLRFEAASRNLTKEVEALRLGHLIDPRIIDDKALLFNCRSTLRFRF